jgi:serine/threonine protein kinase
VHVGSTEAAHGLPGFLSQAGNILIDANGHVNLADFGVAASMERTGSWGHDKSMRMTFVGTPCWMAPEVMEQTQGWVGVAGGTTAQEHIGVGGGLKETAASLSRGCAAGTCDHCSNADVLCWSSAQGQPAIKPQGARFALASDKPLWQLAASPQHAFLAVV